MFILTVGVLFVIKVFEDHLGGPILGGLLSASALSKQKTDTSFFLYVAYILVISSKQHYCTHRL